MALRLQGGTLRLDPLEGSEEERIFLEVVVPPELDVEIDIADVVAVVKYAAAEGIPVVARGAGSGLAGESLCTGIIFDMTRYMNKIISADEKTAVCEPGAVLDDVNNRLGEFGRQIGPDPSTANRAILSPASSSNFSYPTFALA